MHHHIVFDLALLQLFNHCKLYQLATCLMLQSHPSPPHQTVIFEQVSSQARQSHKQVCHGAGEKQLTNRRRSLHDVEDGMLHETYSIYIHVAMPVSCIICPSSFYCLSLSLFKHPPHPRHRRRTCQGWLCHNYQPRHTSC